MSTREDKPRRYFSKLLEIPEQEIDYSEIPATTRAHWENAEVLLSVTADEFRAIKEFLRHRRQVTDEATVEAIEQNALRSAVAALAFPSARAWTTTQSLPLRLRRWSTASAQAAENALSGLFANVAPGENALASGLQAPQENVANTQKDAEIAELRRKLSERDRQIAELSGRIANFEWVNVFGPTRDLPAQGQIPVYAATVRQPPALA